MTDAAPRRWTVEEFFAWQEGQSERYELVDGFPMRMMAGAKNVHDDIVVNVLAELRNQLRGGGCRPFTSDGSVETKPGQIRRPDVGVDCGRGDPDATNVNVRTAPRGEIPLPGTKGNVGDNVGSIQQDTLQHHDHLFLNKMNYTQKAQAGDQVGGI